MDRQVSLFGLPLRTHVVYISRSIGTILGSLIIFPAVVRKVPRSLTKNNRESILDFITKYPGCIIPNIMKKENISKGTVRYHITKLKSEGSIVLKSMGKSLRIFISSHALSDKEKYVACYTNNETDKKILYTLFEYEGLTNQQLSDKLNMRKSTMHKHLKKYLENGLVWYNLDGRNKKYFLDTEIKNILAKNKICSYI